MKKLLKEDVDVFLKYENTKAEPITQMTPNYIYGSIAKPGYYVGGYHFEELEFGGLEQDLKPIDFENGSCIMLGSRIDFGQDNLCNEKLIELILAYNECLKNGYYVELSDKKRIVDYVRRIYEKL